MVSLDLNVQVSLIGRVAEAVTEARVNDRRHHVTCLPPWGSSSFTHCTYVRPYADRTSVEDQLSLGLAYGWINPSLCDLDAEQRESIVDWIID